MRRPWSAAETVGTSTAGLAPAAPTGLSATGGAGSATVEWTNPASLFSYARLYRGTTNVFADAAQLGGDIGGGAGATVQAVDTTAAGTYYYWVRAFNSSGTASPTTGPVQATVT